MNGCMLWSVKWQQLIRPITVTSRRALWRIACLINRLFSRISKKTSNHRDTDLCEENPPVTGRYPHKRQVMWERIPFNSPVTGEFPAQKASNAENVSIWWRNHDNSALQGYFISHKVIIRLLIVEEKILGNVGEYIAWLYRQLLSIVLTYQLTIQPSEDEARYSRVHILWSIHILTHRSQVTHICVIKRSHHWFP